MPREYYEGTWQKERAYSPAVVTSGGRIAWLAGDGGIVEADEELSGQSVELERMQFATDFDTQVHNTFKRIRATLAKVGGKLEDIVTMTVFIKDGRDGQRFVEIRKEYFPQRAPGSALITVTGFAVPEMLVEVQAIAVVGDE